MYKVAVVENVIESLQMTKNKILKSKTIMCQK